MIRKIIIEAACTHIRSKNLHKSEQPNQKLLTEQWLVKSNRTQEMKKVPSS